MYCLIMQTLLKQIDHNVPLSELLFIIEMTSKMFKIVSLEVDLFFLFFCIITNLNEYYYQKQCVTVKNFRWRVKIPDLEKYERSNNMYEDKKNSKNYIFKLPSTREGNHKILVW